LGSGRTIDPGHRDACVRDHNVVGVSDDPGQCVTPLSRQAREPGFGSQIQFFMETVGIEPTEGSDGREPRRGRAWAVDQAHWKRRRPEHEGRGFMVAT
jgi:hypothetical protein